jgi:hypothetical protein
MDDDRLMMRLSWAWVRQQLIFAAIVTTLFFPAVAVIALLGSAMLGLSVHSLATFGDRFGALTGILLWWAVCFVPGLAYTVAFPPWAPVTSQRAPRL